MWKIYVAIYAMIKIAYTCVYIRATPSMNFKTAFILLLKDSYKHFDAISIVFSK